MKKIGKNAISDITQSLILHYALGLVKINPNKSLATAIKQVKDALTELNR
jgi:hypothetical protein